MDNNSTNVRIHLWKSMIASPLETALFYALIYLFKGTYIYVIFCDRGIMPVFCTVCTFIAINLLGFRFWEQKIDFQAVNQLEESLTTVGTIDSAEADRLSQELMGKSIFRKSGLTSSRFSRIMRHVKSGTSWSDTESLVKSMAEVDKDALESSYALVKFLLWLIPILGFIGTVLGIGEAIGGFNSVLSSNRDFDAMKTSLGGITDSLAFAFDSTLVALLQDAVIMFMISMVQKQGDDLTGRIDEVFTDDVLHRVEKIQISGGGGPSLSEEGLQVLEKFSLSAEKLDYLGKLDSFEGVLLEIKEHLKDLAPILSNLQKKRSLSLKIQEVEES